ncbi:MAG: sulfite exporter TauE/SafE family protein [Syntrophobacteraceae bacterium]
MSLIVGLVAGIFGGLVGLGGGVIMIPLMVDFLKMTQHRAHGTSLVAVVFTGIAGAVTYYYYGAVDLVAAGLLAVTATLTARFGAHFAHSLPEWKLKRSFGGFLIFVSLLMLAKPYIPNVESFFPSQEARIIILLVSGVFTGFLSGMMGVGGGTIMVPAMVLCLGFTQQTANGTSLLTMIPAGAAGAWTHFKLNNVQTNLLTGLVPGILVGGAIGGSVANHMPELYLRLLFAAVLIWTGIRYLRACPPPAVPTEADTCLPLLGREDDTITVETK